MLIYFYWVHAHNLVKLNPVFKPSYKVFFFLKKKRKQLVHTIIDSETEIWLMFSGDYISFKDICFQPHISSISDSSSYQIQGDYHLSRRKCRKFRKILKKIRDKREFSKVFYKGRYMLWSIWRSKWGQDVICKMNSTKLL